MLSSSGPDCPPMLTERRGAHHARAAWIVISRITGFTLPGMIELPGCRDGRMISREARARAAGQQAKIVGDLGQADGDGVQRAHQLDLGIPGADGLEPVHRLPEGNTGLLGDCAQLRAARNSGCVLMPVPMAVPPIASSSSDGAHRSTRPRAFSIWRA